MSFSEEIKIRAMVACGRHCCICHKFCGNNMEVHHIKAHADDGSDSFENAIPLCFDCHAIVRQYDPKHPKGIKFSEKELIQHRDNWYRQIKQGNFNTQMKNKQDKIEPIKILHEKSYQKIMLHRVSNGKELLSYLDGTCGIEYSEESETLDEVKTVGNFIQYIKELIDFDDLIEEPSDRIMTSFNLTENIKELELAGFWVFVGRENRVMTGGIGNDMLFPTFLISVVRKENSDIIKMKFDRGKSNHD